MGIRTQLIYHSHIIFKRHTIWQEKFVVEGENQCGDLSHSEIYGPYLYSVKACLQKAAKHNWPQISVIKPQVFCGTIIATVIHCYLQKSHEKLANVSYFSTTTDLWSSRMSEPYLSLTVHYIDEKWTLLNVCLKTSYFPDDHTSETIAQGLKDARRQTGVHDNRQRGQHDKSIALEQVCP